MNLFANRRPRQRGRNRLEAIRDWAWDRHMAAKGGLERYGRGTFARLCLDVWADLETQLRPDWADYLQLTRET